MAGCDGAAIEELTTDHIAVFKQARKNTVEATQYSYDFNLSAKIKFKNAVNFSPATYSGTTYVNTANPGTQFLQRRNLSGALIIDSTNYVYNVDTDLIKVSADDNNDFSVINHETVSSVYDFDKNNFGYILKTLNDEGLLKADYKDKKYILSLHTNFSQDSLLSMFNFIDSKTIIKAINAYSKKEWGVGLSVNAWATVDESKQHLSTFHFDASISIKNTFDIGFEFEQTFKAYSGVSINLPTFENTIVNESDVKNELNSIKNIYVNSKNASSSYYSYDVKTTVDHGVSKSNPLGLAVNSRTQGYAKRQIIDDTVFFNNRLMVDSDYKNSDQLGNLVEDYDSYRARLNDTNKTVYDVLDPKVGLNKYTELASYNEDSIDDYYMLPSENYISYDNFKVLKKTTDSSSKTTYKFGLSNSEISTILNDYNRSFRIGFKRETIFDIYKIQSDFVAKKALFSIVKTSDNKLDSIELDLKGFYTEMGSNDQVKYRLQVSIDYDWSKTYTAVTTKGDIDNN